jgi:CarD-like protein
MPLPKLSELTDQTSWNRRYKDMLELVHQSDEARALVLQALILISKKKDLSFGERKMFDMCSNYEQYLEEKSRKDTLARAVEALERRKLFRLSYGKE